jgi:hypothetical protein
MSRLVVELSPVEHRNLKTRAAISGKTLTAYVKSYLFKIPNATTLEALHDIENKENLVEFGSIEDLLTI